MGGIKPERNYGIDLLRIVAMWMICCQHIINRGGVYAAVGEQRQLLYPLWVLSTAGVNLYALISGYVGVNGRFHPARVAELWLQVFVLDLVLSTAGSLYNPAWMDADMWRRNLMPLTQKAYWYFTAYVGVYAFTPLINRGVQALNPKQCRALIWLMLALFSLGSAAGYSNQGDPWSIGGGYSVLWLLALYVTGACVRHSGFGQKAAWWKLALAAAACVLLSTLWREIVTAIPEPSPFWKNQRDPLLSYTNPMLAAFSLLMLLIFSRIRLGGAAAACVKLLSPLTFGVYVIHVHHVNWTWIETLYKPLGKLPVPLVIPAVLAAGLGLFLACAALDWLRSLLFRLLRIRPRLDRLETRILGRLQ